MNTEQKDKKRLKRPANMIAAGLVIGVGVGAAIDNIGAGIAIGIAIGAALSRRGSCTRENPEDNDKSS